VTSYLIGGLALALLCSGWVLFQRWVADRDPEVRGPESGCHGCGGCTGACERGGDREADLPPARVTRRE